MRFKLLVLFLCLSVVGSAQFTNYTRIANRYRYLAGAFDSTFTPPLYNGTPSGLRSGSPTLSGHFAIDTANGRPYFYQSGNWQRIAKFSELTGGALYVDSIWRVAGKDSIFWLKNGTTYKFLDSTGGANIYNSNGTLTGIRNLNANGYRMKFDNLQYFDFEFTPNTNSYFRFDPQFTNFYLWDTVSGSAVYQDIVANPGDVFTQIGARNKADFFVGSNSSQNSGYIQLITVKNSGSEEQRIDMDSAGIKVRPFRGAVNIDTLVTSTDLTGKKIVVHDTTTGDVTRVDASLIGGGTYTAGNGLTLSGSEFRLGGTIGSTQILGNGVSGSIYIDSVNSIVMGARSHPDNTFLLSYPTSAGIQYRNAGTIRTEVATTNAATSIRTGSGATYFNQVTLSRSDSSVRIGTMSKKLFIDTLQSGGGETMVYNRSTNAVSFRVDTITLAVFGAGSGAAGDTAAFTTDALYGSIYIDVDTFVVTKIVAVIQAGATDTLGIQIYFNDSLNTGTTGVATSTLALTSRPQGHSTTTLSNATIPPGNFIWCKSPTVVAGRKPEYLSVSLIGYRKRRI